ncbi:MULTISPECIES: hypothetical protein [unclassified Allobranchiibius]|uniref:hypothetical protein n=1 Tax=unclassified Allobranchiibius TaxID=2649857 RepID=UPI001AA1971B|nr:MULTISPECIES: hypothetical protein [unclassified Allobranchiibius]MBO1765413.1 hypothetical protein [Allobranchiibius sp. GilTou38]UIJ35278.1 hypothetical protein LVQ62_02505 [Allobranchiibius sp. GilTou73]
MNSFRALPCAAAIALTAGVLAGCGSANAPGGSTTTTSSSAPSSTSSSATSSPTAGGSPTAKDVTLTGTVSGDRLPCVRLHTTDGHQYVITGAVPGKLYTVAHSGGSRTSITAQPSPPQTATVTVVGHTASGLMNTCGGTTFVVSSATIHSITTG